MSASNPNIQQAMDYIQQNGGDPRTAFYNYAKQIGANPNNALNQARNMMSGSQN